MKKLVILLMLALMACINATAQNFERAVPENARRGVIERYADWKNGIFVEKRHKRISSIYTKQVWVEVYDQWVVTFVMTDCGWQRVSEIDRINGPGGVAAEGFSIYGKTNMKVKVGCGPQFTRVMFVYRGNMWHSYVIDVPKYMQPYQKKTYPRRRHNPHPGRIR